MSAFFGTRFHGRTISGSLDLADYLLEQARIACVPGIAFGDDRFIRLSYAADKALIGEGMDRLEEALDMLER
jgi:aspartate aminotransferase